MPPEWMWPFDNDLDQWFAEVEEKRKERYGRGGGDDDDTDDKDKPMMTNELARRRKGRGR